MKKILFFIILLLLPISIKGIGIDSANISNSGKTVVDNYLDYKVNINFNDLDKNKDIGIWFIAFELDYDDTVFATAGVSSPGFNSTIYIENGKYYVLSEVIEGVSNSNCKSGSLSCSNYSINIKFYTYQTTITNSDIKVKELEVVTLNMIDPNKQYTLDDANILTANVLGNTSISIKPSIEEIKNKKVESIAKTSAPTVSSVQVQNNTVQSNNVEQPKKEENKVTGKKISESKEETKEVYKSKDKKSNSYDLFNFKIDKKIMNYGIIIFAIIIVTIVVVIIINKIRDNKVDKQIKNFDKF